MSLIHADCLDAMAAMDADSIDAIVTDPPYGLGFMGKAWDQGFEPTDNPMRRRAEVDAVNAGASRQGGRQRAGDDYQKRQARDARAYQTWCEAWAREAFRIAKPGAHLLAFGGTRTVHRLAAAIEDAGWEIRDMLVWGYASGFPKSHNLDGEWNGWGTALKPAWEPIVMARKPLRGTVAVNVLAHGTGALNIDGTRIGYVNEEPPDLVPNDNSKGRWPANVILTDEVFGDEYSRFFLIPKSARSEREPVLGGLPLREAEAGDQHHSRVRMQPNGMTPRGTDGRPQRANVHPTVKPLDLMRHLVRLVTPPGGTVLDPFLGSGTTALAAEMEGFAWIGIEKEAEYIAIAEARLNGTQRGLGLTG